MSRFMESKDIVTIHSTTIFDLSCGSNLLPNVFILSVPTKFEKVGNILSLVYPYLASSKRVNFLKKMHSCNFRKQNFANYISQIHERIWCQQLFYHQHQK